MWENGAALLLMTARCPVRGFLYGRDWDDGMSLFNHEHGYALSDEDQNAMRLLARWDESSPLPQISDRQIEHLIGQLYNAMNAMNDQRVNAFSSEVAEASNKLWEFYRREHTMATRLRDARSRLLRRAA